MQVSTEAVSCPPFLHTSESDQRTIGQDNSVIFPCESSTKCWDTALTGPGHNGANDQQDTETQRCEHWENLCSLYCGYRKHQDCEGTGPLVGILDCEVVKSDVIQCFPCPLFTHLYKVNDAACFIGLSEVEGTYSLLQCIPPRSRVYFMIRIFLNKCARFCWMSLNIVPVTTALQSCCKFSFLHYAIFPHHLPWSGRKQYAPNDTAVLFTEGMQQLKVNFTPSQKNKPLASGNKCTHSVTVW